MNAPNNVTSLQKKVPLEKWIFDAINDTEHDTKISAISLVMLKGEAEQEVDSVKFSKSGNYEPKILSQRFKGKAEQFVQDLPGVHTFCLLAFYGNEVLARQPFRINVAHDYGSLGTESPTEQGMRQADMRRHEMTYQQMFMKQAHLDQTMMRVMDRFESMNANLMRSNAELLEISQNLMVQISQAQHNKEMEKLKFVYDRDERAKLLRMAPALMNTITGSEIFPQSTEDTTLIEAIAEELKPEHIAMLGSILPKEKVAILADRLNRYQLKKLEEEEAVKKLPVFKGSPDGDIGGGSEK